MRGGIPQKNDVLNQVYANVLGRPVLVPSKSVTSLGSAIFAFLAAGTFKTIEDAQKKICPSNRVFEPDKSEQSRLRRAVSACTAKSISPLAIPRRMASERCFLR